MKKIIMNHTVKGTAAILALFLLLFPTAKTAASSILEKPTLKVLDIGNSYTIDATNLLPLIAEASGSDLSTICIYRTNRGGGSFKNWYDVYHDCDDYPYTVRKVTGDLPSSCPTGNGTAMDGSLFRRVLTEETWDLIIIHPLSLYAPYYEQWNLPESASGYLDELLALIRQHQPTAEIGFLLSHSYWSGYTANTEHSSLLRWEKIADSARRFCSDYDVSFVIPYGTAIQNLRSSSFNNEYDLTRDGSHCCMGLGQYTAACCYYEALIAPRSGITVLGNPARYDASGDVFAYPSVSVTDENALVAQVAAVLAVEDWYSVRNPEDYIHILSVAPAGTPSFSHPSRTSGLYDLQGRRVDAPTQRGIYIRNGKKMMVK